MERRRIKDQGHASSGGRHGGDVRCVSVCTDFAVAAPAGWPVEQMDNGKACGYVYVVMVLLVATAGRLNTRGARAGGDARERRENANRCVCVWTQQV